MTAEAAGAHVSAGRSPPVSVSSRCLALLYFGLHGALGRSVPRDDRLQPAVFRRNLRRAGACDAVSRRPADSSAPTSTASGSPAGSARLCLLAAIRRPAAQVTLAWLAAAVSVDRDQRIARTAAVFHPGGARPWRSRRRAASRRHGVARPGLEDRADPRSCWSGAWRVGDEPGPAWRPRLFGVPELIDNIAFDVSYWRGRMQPGGLSRAIRRHRRRGQVLGARGRGAWPIWSGGETRPTDRIYVFGFASGGVYAKSRRWSSSRFFWSRPVVIEFDAGTPGYGSAGLLADLERQPPAIVALQKRDWRLGEAHVPNSIEFFLGHAAAAHVARVAATCAVEDGVVFAVWRRKTMTPSRRRVLALSLLILAVRSRTSHAVAARRPADDGGWHRLARRGRLGTQRPQPGAVGHVADRRVESDLHRAGLHRARIRRLRSFRRRDLAGAHGARSRRASPPSCCSCSASRRSPARASHSSAARSPPPTTSS